MIKNIIFDMDGVLLDTEYATRTASIEMFAKLGLQVQHEDFKPFTGMGEARFVGGVAEKYGLTYEDAMKEEVYRIYDITAQKNVTVFPGIPQLIQTLHQMGYQVAVASAADRIKVEINLRCIGLTEQDFDGVVTGSDVSRHKPDPEIFLKAAQKLGANPDTCIVIEDAVAGCQGAIVAGMRCIGVTSTFEPEQLLKAGAFTTVSQTPEILGVLQTIE